TLAAFAAILRFGSDDSILAFRTASAGTQHVAVFAAGAFAWPADESAPGQHSDRTEPASEVHVLSGMEPEVPGNRSQRPAGSLAENATGTQQESLQRLENRDVTQRPEHGVEVKDACDENGGGEDK